MSLSKSSTSSSLSLSPPILPPKSIKDMTINSNNINNKTSTTSLKPPLSNKSTATIKTVKSISPPSVNKNNQKDKPKNKDKDNSDSINSQNNNSSNSNSNSSDDYNSDEKKEFYDTQFEFDAPQYIDFQTLDFSKEEENFDEWFDCIHISHESEKPKVILNYFQKSSPVKLDNNKTTKPDSTTSTPPISLINSTQSLSPTKDHNSKDNSPANNIDNSSSNSINLNNTVGKSMFNSNIKSLFKDLSGTLKPERVSINSNSLEDSIAALEQIKSNLPPKPIRLSSQNLKRLSSNNSSNNSNKISHCRLSSLNRRFSKLSSNGIISSSTSATASILNTIASNQPTKRVSINQINNSKLNLNINNNSINDNDKISNNNVNNKISTLIKPSIIIKPVVKKTIVNSESKRRKSILSNNISIRSSIIASSNNSSSNEKKSIKPLIKPNKENKIEISAIPTKERMSITSIKKRRSVISSNGNIVSKDRFICNGNTPKPRLSMKSNISINSKLNSKDSDNNNNHIVNTNTNNKPHVNNNSSNNSNSSNNNSKTSIKKPLAPSSLSLSSSSSLSGIKNSSVNLNNNNNNIQNNSLKKPIHDSSNKENSINIITNSSIFKKSDISIKSSSTDKKPPITNKNKIPVLNKNNNNHNTFLPQEYSKIK